MVVRHIGLQPKFVEYVNRQLQNGIRARFPLTRTVMKTRVIPTQEVSANVVDLFNGKYNKVCPFNAMFLYPCNLCREIAHDLSLWTCGEQCIPWRFSKKPVQLSTFQPE